MNVNLTTGIIVLTGVYSCDSCRCNYCGSLWPISNWDTNHEGGKNGPLYLFRSIGNPNSDIFDPYRVFITPLETFFFFLLYGAYLKI